MIIQEQIEDGVLIAAPEGELDTLHSPELERFLASRYDQVRQVIFDMEKVSYISSAGLRVLIQAYKIMKEKAGVLLRNVTSPQVQEILTLTGYARVLKNG